MGMTYDYVAGFASSVSVLSLYPQLALWARRMSPALLAGSIQKSCGQSTGPGFGEAMVFWAWLRQAV
jgi:hypothetical protein